MGQRRAPTRLAATRARATRGRAPPRRRRARASTSRSRHRLPGRSRSGLALRHAGRETQTARRSPRLCPRPRLPCSCSHRDRRNRESQPDCGGKEGDELLTRLAMRTAKHSFDALDPQPVVRLYMSSGGAAGLAAHSAVATPSAFVMFWRSLYERHAQTPRFRRRRPRSATSEYVEGVLAPRQLRIDNRAGRDGSQLRDERSGVLDDDNGVAIAVGDEEGRRVGAQIRQRRTFIIVVVAVVAVQRDGGGDGGIGVLEAGLEARVVRGEGSRRSEVGAR